MSLLSQLKSTSEEKGLLLNTEKTKIMDPDKNDSGADFLLDGQKAEVVKQFEYALGLSWVTDKQQMW